VLAGDFHVHSFPGDGALAPWDIAHEASRRRLDVVALTNHNAMLSWRLAKALGWTPSGVLVIPAEEVTGVGFHMAAVGLDHPVSWRGSIVDAAAAVHAQGGVAIGAHPVGPFRPSYTPDAFRALDGIEAAHPGMFETERAHLEFAEVYRDALAAHPGIAAIGSTDFHTWAPLGECRTYLFVHSATAGGVIDAIRAGRTVACDAKGIAYGPPALRTLVQDDCRADATASPAGEIVGLSRTSASLTWLALVALVLLGSERPA
jgi:predicted metal-dependent phosphoesterase TrpH